jgi:ribokinase
MTVIVVGSANADTTATVDRLPNPGQTVHARSIDRRGGGKGANVAFAAAASTSDVVLVAQVGADADGDLALSGLEVAGVSLRHVRRSESATGTALILVDAVGENCIVVDPGANFAWSATEAASAIEPAMRPGAVVVTNFEVPASVCLAAARVAAADDATFVLNPSPLEPLSPELVACAPLVVVNAAEAAALASTFGAVVDNSESAARTIAAVTGAPVVVTLGAQGAGVLDGDWVLLPGVQAEAVDTTGAGDAFLGALVAALVNGDSLLEAATAGVAYASLAVQSRGARLPRGG